MSLIVDVVESFIYLGSEIHSSGSSEPEVRRRIGLAKSCRRLYGMYCG